MKKNYLFMSLFLLVSSAFYCQSSAEGIQKPKSNKKATTNQKQITYTPLKPVDGQPAVFGSIEERDASVPGKITNVYTQIANNIGDSERVKLLRMELWRLQNATVLAPH